MRRPSGFHQIHQEVILWPMRRATITIPDELAEGLACYSRAQDNPPTLTKVVQSALRAYLQERGYLQVRRPLHIRAARKGSGQSDVSQQHDRYLAEP